MQRALVCAVLIACKGGAPSEDKRQPAQAPVALVADAAIDAPPDAPSGPCYALPFGMDAERAGIRKLTIRTILPMPRKKQLPGVTKLVVGKPTLVRGLKPSLDDSPLTVVDVGADALVTMAKETPAGFLLTAPPHTKSAVLRIEGGTNALVAVGDEGLVSLARYRENYVPARRFAAASANETVTSIEPLAIFAIDIGGPLVLASYSELGNGAVTWLEVGLLTNANDSRVPETAFAKVPRTALPLYFVPPTASGGRRMLVGSDGTRILFDIEKLTLTPLLVPVAQPRCLRISATEPAQFLD